MTAQEEAAEEAQDRKKKKHFAWEDRRKGLTTAEKTCLGRRPRPSPSCQQKIHAGESSANSPTAAESPTVAARRKRRSEVQKVTRIHVDVNAMEEDEEACRSILNRLLPLPAVASPGSHKLSRASTDVEGRGHGHHRLSPTKSKSAPLHRDGSKGVMANSPSGAAGGGKEVPSTPMRTLRCSSLPAPTSPEPSRGSSLPAPSRNRPQPTTPSMPTSAQASSTSEVNLSASRELNAQSNRQMSRELTANVSGKLSAEELQERMILLRRRVVDFDPNSDPDVANVVRLIQGATAQRIERQVGGKIVFVHDEGDTGKAQTALPSSCASQLQAAGHPLHVFRRKMLEKHGSVQEAFNSFNVEQGRHLNMREWCEILSKSKFCSMMEARVIYELLDADHDGSLTLPELQLGLEAVAPVTSIEGLRKRLICLGVPSMMQAISIMNGPGEDMTMNPLTLPEFATCLKRVWVLQDHEHRALFEQVRDPLGADPWSSRASLSDLAAALAAISPCLLTEELRPHLKRRWGSLEKAYAALDDSWLSSCEAFVHGAKDWHGLSAAEATRVFQFTDIDGSGDLEHTEIVGVLELSAPSLNMEDCRRKVQQSHRCIEAALRDALTHEPGGELNDTLRFNVDELIEVLEPLDMQKKEKSRLAKFLGATGDRGITLCEFFKGIRLLTPSCVLEAIRLKLLQVVKKPVDAFRGVRNRRQPLTRVEFAELLKSVGAPLDEETLDGLMEVLDIRSSGIITITEFLSALRASELGTRKKQAVREVNSGAEKFVREELAPLSQTVSEVKRGLRAMKKSKQGEEIVESPPRPPRNMPMPRSASVPNRLHGKASPPPPPAGNPGANRPSSTGSNMQLQGVFNKTTFSKFTQAFGSPLDQERKRKTLENLQGYLSMKEDVMKGQEVALQGRFRKAALEREMSHLRRFAQPRVMANPSGGFASQPNLLTSESGGMLS